MYDVILLSMPLPLLKVIAKIFDCEINDIAEHLYFPSNRERLEAILKGVWVQTNYANRKGLYFFKLLIFF